MLNLLRRIRPILRFLRTAWSIAGITLIAILLTEAGFRLVFAIKDHFGAVRQPDPRVIEQGYGGQPWVVQHQRELEQLQDRWQPYVYFRQKPFSGQTIAIDQDGLRLTWQPPPVPAGPAEPRAFKVLMLGGSSLWGYGARDDRTIPSIIARSLHQRGYRIELRNLAEIGYVSTQEVVALLRELQSGYRPDLVIFYDGVNDTTSAFLEGEAGVTTNERNRRAEFNIRQSPGAAGDRAPRPADRGLRLLPVRPGDRTAADRRARRDRRSTLRRPAERARGERRVGVPCQHLDRRSTGPGISDSMFSITGSRSYSRSDP